MSFQLSGQTRPILAVLITSANLLEYPTFESVFLMFSLMFIEPGWSIQGLFNRWTSQLDLGSTTGGVRKSSFGT